MKVIELLMETRVINDIGFECCFCRNSITPDNINPCDLNILSNIDKDLEEQCDQTFYCHLNCFRSTLHKRIAPLLIIDSKKHHIYQSHKQTINTLKARNLCCFCTQKIESDNVNPCDINIMSNFGKPKEEQYNQTFYCHVQCLRFALHKNIQSYLVLDIDD